MSIGLKLSPILEEIEDALIEFECIHSEPPGFTDEAYRAVLKVFMAATMERMWRLQGAEKMTFEDRVAMVHSLGAEMRKLVKVYTDIDTHQMYSKAS